MKIQIVKRARASAYILKVFTLFCFTLGEGCKKLVEVDPPITSPVTATVFTNNKMAASVMTGIYNRMIQFDGTMSSGSQSISLLVGLSSDELKNYSTTGIGEEFYTNGLNAIDMNIFWNEAYQYIYTANSVLEGLSQSKGVNPAVAKQLTGEAEFIRAFFHFYLLNLFGDVPLVLTTDYRINAIIHRSPKVDVYNQIVADLKDAKAQLSENFVGSDAVTATTERVRPTKWAASALLARAFLYLGDWIDAEAEANSILNSQSFDLEGIDGAFLKNNQEAIWQLQPVLPGYNTFDAFTFILKTEPGSGQQSAALSTQLLAAFESGDRRRSGWVDSMVANGTTYYYPHKYKVMPGLAGSVVSEYLMVFRLVEQYLIRSEARAQQNNIGGAQSDLNIVRGRASLGNISAATQASLLAAIQHERQVELFTEWGHRWLDLKRTGQVNTVMANVTPLKGGSWNPNWQLFPIPNLEIQRNPNLSQNAGY